VQLLLGWDFRVLRDRLESGRKSTPFLHNWSCTMSARHRPTPTTETREQRIEALLQQLRPKVDALVRQLVERAVDVPEAEEFGAIDFEFRDAGQQLVNEVRQASVVSRKKRGT
jgi:hypothetical protein